jgi:hypothetical protein
MTVAIISHAITVGVSLPDFQRARAFGGIHGVCTVALTISIGVVAILQRVESAGRTIVTFVAVRIAAHVWVSGGNVAPVGNAVAVTVRLADPRRLRAVVRNGRRNCTPASAAGRIAYLAGIPRSVGVRIGLVGVWY